MKKNYIKLSDEIHSLFNQGKFSTAKKKIILANEYVDKQDEKDYMLLATIAGLFMDLGFEARDKEAAEKGVNIMSENEERFKDFLSIQSFNYNLANGFHALYRIQNGNNHLPTLEEIRPYLTRSKNYYFKAFKEVNLKKIQGLDLQILTNLANNLVESGRVTEAIRLYSSVLKVNPEFWQSLIGFGESLDYWLTVSFNPGTIALYLKMYSLFQKGLENGNMPPTQTNYFNTQKQKYAKLLRQHKFDFSIIEKELEINALEYEKHSLFRKFCIDNYLSLNEHSIYCNCIAASEDDLSIVEGKMALYGDKVGKMELLLNRLKSEFHISRKLFFEGVSNDKSPEKVIFSDLMDGEKIGEDIEKIRTAFRLCFGIFDKIAHGICYFFDLPKNKKQKEKENIYFENFWEANRCPERWDKLKDFKNPHLVALYSIANDFNSSEGEFSFYKQWRNKLEHNNLILVDETDKPDIFELFNDSLFITRIDYTDFKEQALHLLQISCAAIFSYTYLIRTESLQKQNGGGNVPFIIQPKIADR